MPPDFGTPRDVVTARRDGSAQRKAPWSEIVAMMLAAYQVVLPVLAVLCLVAVLSVLFVRLLFG